MSTFETKTLFVTEPVIDLGVGIFLPIGTYLVEVEYLPLILLGHEYLQIGRVLLRITQEALENLGSDVSDSLHLDAVVDVSRFLGKPGVRIG